LPTERNSDAVDYLEKLAQNPQLDEPDLHWLVRTFVTLDATDKAIHVLEKTGGTGIDNELMLARLYRRVGRGPDAARLYKSMLDQPIMQPAFWVEGANFLASQHDLAAADQFLARARRAFPETGRVLRLIWDCFKRELEERG